MIRSLIWHFMFVAVAVLAVNVHAQIPEGWEIVTITDDPNVFDGVPDINERGQMVFSSQLDLSDRASNEIFLYDRGNLIRLTNDDIRDIFPRINNKGEIVWSRDVNGDGVLGIVRQIAGQLEVISDQEAYHEASVDINDHGQIVWSGIPVGIIPNDDDLFFFDDGKTVRITNDEYVNSQPRINEKGQFVWTQFDFSVGPWQSKIMLYDNGSISELANSEDQDGQIQVPNLNDNLDVVWASSRTGVQLWRDGVVITVTEDGRGASINNEGVICFGRFDRIVEFNWGAWMFRDETFTQIMPPTFGALSAGVTDRGEVALSWGLPFERHVALMTSPVFRADSDFDGDVDLGDFAILQNCWNEATSFGAACSEADLNADGVVDLQDVAMFIEHLGGPGINGG